MDAETLLQSIVYSRYSNEYLLEQLRELFESGYSPNTNTLLTQNGSPSEDLYYSAFHNYINRALYVVEGEDSDHPPEPFIELFLEYGGEVSESLTESLFIWSPIHITEWRESLSRRDAEEIVKNIPIRARIIDTLGTNLDESYIREINFQNVSPDTRSFDSIPDNNFDYWVYFYSRLKYTSKYLQEFFPVDTVFV